MGADGTVHLVGIVLVSHSAEVARGLGALVRQIAGPEVKIEAVGGAPDGGLGTSADAVRAAILRNGDAAGTVVLADIGSSLLAVRAVLESDSLDGRKIALADAPLVEGAIAAAVVCSAGGSLDAVMRAAEEARGQHKL